MKKGIFDPAIFDNAIFDVELDTIVLDDILEKGESRDKKAFIPNLVKIIKVDPKIWVESIIMLRYVCRLSTSDKTIVQSNMNHAVYLDDGQTIYNLAWLVKAQHEWDGGRNANKPWKSSLTFAVIAKEIVDPYENFLLWTEVDPNNKLSATATRATWTDMIRNEACYRYKAKSTSSEFTHTFEYIVSSIDVNADSSNNIIAYIWCVCENSGRPSKVDVGDIISLSVLEKGSSTTQYRLYLSHGDDIVQDTSIDLDVGTIYYLTITKSGTVVTCYIYDDAGKTSLVDTLTMDLVGQAEANRSFNYAETTASFDAVSDGNDQSDGWVQNMTLS